MNAKTFFIRYFVVLPCLLSPFHGHRRHEKLLELYRWEII